MQQEQKSFRTFEDLEVYQVAREFRKMMYRVAKRLPDVEKFGLVSQIRRAAVSLTNNIAEGHGRYHYLERNTRLARILSRLRPHRR
jgi:four helix bundle protein